MPRMVTLNEYMVFLIGGLSFAAIGFVIALVQIYRGR
jgi:hypothetical protein